VSYLRIRANAIDLAQFKVLNGVILLRSPKSKAFGSRYIIPTTTTTIGRGRIPLNLQLWIKILLHFQHFSAAKKQFFSFLFKKTEAPNLTFPSHSLSKENNLGRRAVKRRPTPEPLLDQKEKGEANCVITMWKFSALRFVFVFPNLKTLCLEIERERRGRLRRRNGKNWRGRGGTSHGEGMMVEDHSIFSYAFEFWFWFFSLFSSVAIMAKSGMETPFMGGGEAVA